MRRVLTFVGLLTVAGLVAFAPTSTVCAGGGAERQDPLAVADQLEQEGRAHLEAGRKAEGAKLISKAWAIRAEVFAHADGERPKRADGETREKPQVRPELEALQARVLELKARSNATEREGKELKESGHADEAHAKMEESGRLWREAEELQRKIDSVRGAKADGAGAELKAALERLRADVAEQRARAEKEAQAGNESAAREAKEAAADQTRKIAELEAKLRAMQGGGGPREGGDAVASLAQQLEKLMRRMNEMQEKMNALQRRLDEKSK